MSETQTMTLREMNLRVFQRRPIPHVFFQPRFEPWLDWHRQFDSLPPQVEGLSLREAYDLIGASMRTVHYYSGQPDPIVTRYTDDVKVTERREGDLLKHRIDTRYGPLFQTQKFTVDRTWRTVEFLAKKPQDLPALRWLVQRRIIRFSEANFKQGAEFVGDRGIPQFWVPKSPYFALAQQLMRYEDFIYALADETEIVEEIMEIIDESYDALYEQLTAAGPGDPMAGLDAPGLLRILNFGENVAEAYLSKRYFEAYVLPWYEKRAGQLRDAGIYTHVHIDGYFRMLLPYLADLPFDGLEALTPEPQGDVTLEEMHEAMGGAAKNGKILLDGIPAILFLDHYPRETLEACVEQIVDLFHPNLVLGISDELPEAGGEESFKRMARVSAWCREWEG
ncbi:MAG: hypothetical protein ACP5JG_10120 [Anaerolineae bacterium]